MESRATGFAENGGRRSFLLWGPLILVCLCLPACREGFDPPSLVEYTRILAIKAEPPEVNPGGTITLTPLVANPSREPLTYQWLLYEDASFLESPGTKEGPAGDPIFEYNGEVCALPVPPNLLDELGGLESVNIPVVLRIVQGDTVRQGFKGVLISWNTTDPNRNPEIAGIMVNGEFPVIIPIIVPASTEEEDSVINLEVVLEAFSIDSEEEEITTSWYSEFGEFDYNGGRVNSWTAPEEEVGTYIIAVVRDEQGGTDWFEIAVEVIR